MGLLSVVLGPLSVVVALDLGLPLRADEADLGGQGRSRLTTGGGHSIDDRQVSVAIHLDSKISRMRSLYCLSSFASCPGWNL